MDEMKADLDREIIDRVPNYMVEKRTLSWYLDRALKNYENMSHRKLAQHLDVSPSVVHSYRHGRAFPTDQNMLEIARLAGVDPAVSLIDLNLWRTEGAAQSVYKKMLEKITVSLFLAILFTAQPAHASLTEHSLTFERYVNSDYTLSHLFTRLRLYVLRRIKGFFTLPDKNQAFA